MPIGRTKVIPFLISRAVADNEDPMTQDRHRASSLQNTRVDRILTKDQEDLWAAKTKIRAETCKIEASQEAPKTSGSKMTLIVSLVIQSSMMKRARYTFTGTMTKTCQRRNRSSTTLTHSCRVLDESSSFLVRKKRPKLSFRTTSKQQNTTTLRSCPSI